MTYATQQEIDHATAKGYAHESDTQLGCSFQKLARRVWSVRDGWQTADLIDGQYTNHRKYTDLIEALDRPAFNLFNSINITAREWFDKANGNSYFSATIEIDGQHVGDLPFQYGYGDHYLDMANGWLDEHDYIDNPRHENGTRTPLRLYCEKHGITLYNVKIENCRKREL